MYQVSQTYWDKQHYVKHVLGLNLKMNVTYIILTITPSQIDYTAHHLYDRTQTTSAAVVYLPAVCDTLHYCCLQRKSYTFNYNNKNWFSATNTSRTLPPVNYFLVTGECVQFVQGHSRSSNLKLVYDFLLVIYCDLRSLSHRCQDTALSSLNKPLHVPSTPCSPRHVRWAGVLTDTRH